MGQEGQGKGLESGPATRTEEDEVRQALREEVVQHLQRQRRRRLAMQDSQRGRLQQEKYKDKPRTRTQERHGGRQPTVHARRHPTGEGNHCIRNAVPRTDDMQQDFDIDIEEGTAQGNRTRNGRIIRRRRRRSDHAAAQELPWIRLRQATQGEAILESGKHQLWGSR